MSKPPGGPYYLIPRETWDEAKCRKIANCTRTDGMGTPYPFKGYLQMLYQSWGYTRYNGGISRDGQWYQGEFRPFPSLAPGYVIVSVLSWGTRLIREVDRGGAYDGPLTQVSEYEG